MDPSYVRKWLSLFEKELIELLTYNPEKWSILCDLLPHNRMKQYESEAANIEIKEDNENLDQLEDVARRLWSDIINTVNTPNLLIKVCEFVHKVNPDLCILLQHQGVSQTRLANFLRILIHIEQYINTIDALNYLSSYSFKMALTLEPIQQRLNKNEITECEARKLLFRNIPFFGQHAVEHLLYAVWSNGSNEAKQMVEKLKPRFEQLYDHILSVESRPNRIIVPGNVSFETALESLYNHKNDPLDTIEIPKICKLSVLMDYAKEMPLNLREYQKELAEHAINGENTLICAPTNSGKTRVAVHVMRQRYYHALETQQPFKAVFLVPTRVLVEQQFNVLQNYFSQLKIEHLSGDANGSQPILAKINSADITVITPQLFLNALKSNQLAEYEQVKIVNFSLIVFDESHRCNEKHPYNEILKIYHDTKLTSNLKMPQVIGLTATIGLGDSKDLQQTIDYVAKICANLDVHRINHVRKNRAELKKNVPVTVDELVKCSEENGEFFEILIELKIWFENSLLCLITDDEKLRKRIEEALRIGNLDHDVYSGIKQLENYFTTDSTLEDEKRQMAVQILQHLITINNTARCVRLFDKETALFTFEEHEAKHSSNKSNIFTRRMSEALIRLRTKNDFNLSPMLQELINEIKYLFNKDPKAARCLIFTERREHCAILAELIKKHTEREARYLTGAASAENKGLNENQQRETLEDFKSGRVSILCATSVADEGLDIAECKLVIKYNYVTNAIAHVQRRGRGRALDTRSILLAENNFVQEREKENIKKEKIMNDSLNFIDLDLDGFFSKVDDQILKNKEDREKERLRQLERRERQNSQSVYVMICKQCDSFIALSTDIYLSHGQHYVVADPEIWTRVNVNQKSPIFLPESSAPTIGKIFCQNTSQVQGGKCGANIGSVIIDKSGGGVRLPIFSVKSLAFINAGVGYTDKRKPFGNYERCTRSQWKKVVEQLFETPEIGQNEIAAMLQVRPQCNFNEETNRLIQSCSS